MKQNVPNQLINIERERKRPMSETKKPSWAFSQRKRAERIWGIVGTAEYPDLTAVDTAVALALNHHSDIDGAGMRPSVETLTQMTNFSRSSVARSLARLLDVGLLIVEGDRERRGRAVCYRFGDALLEAPVKLRTLLEAKRASRMIK